MCNLNLKVFTPAVFAEGVATGQVARIIWGHGCQANRAGSLAFPLLGAGGWLRRGQRLDVCCCKEAVAVLAVTIHNLHLVPAIHVQQQLGQGGSHLRIKN